MKRRDALKLAGAMAVSAMFTPAIARAKPLRVLILGGTGFIGPHFVDALSANKHKISLFNRGKRDPEARPGIEQLIGDRNGDLKSLEGRDWDVVVDNSGYTPKQVRATAELLKGHADRYIFISSVAVYADFKKPGIAEDYPLAQLKDPTTDTVTGETYGGLKVLAEKVVEEVFDKNATIIRPTYIAGPGDVTDRFTYWPWRVSKGGEMLAPGSPADPFQYIDVRDLAQFVLACVEKKVVGAFNLCKPAITMGELLETSKKVTGADTKIVWASPEFLTEHAIIGEKAEGNFMPIWTPANGEDAGIVTMSCSRAQASGLELRPLEATIRDTLAWQAARPAEKQKLRAGLSFEKETELLAKFKLAQSSA
jgi:2'-hydroxyisoflavone reductase